MNGQEIPEEFKRITSETGYYIYNIYNIDQLHPVHAAQQLPESDQR